jgi:hypothetical protein
MRCDDVAELLLAPDAAKVEADVDTHVASCARCSHVARGVLRLDAILATTLVVEPPLDLQRQLAQLALAAARPQPAPWWRRALQGELKLDWLVLRPNVVAAQGLATLMVALASWQIFGWLTAFRPVVGDVAYAVELVAASPATVYLGGLQIDVQSVGVWSLVGIVGWLVSENGTVGRGVTALTDRFRLP